MSTATNSYGTYNTIYYTANSDNNYIPCLGCDANCTSYCAVNDSNSSSSRLSGAPSGTDYTVTCNWNDCQTSYIDSSYGADYSITNGSNCITAHNNNRTNSTGNGVASDGKY